MVAGTFEKLVEQMACEEKPGRPGDEERPGRPGDEEDKVIKTIHKILIV